jgi:Chromo (CHRromatin Organisation MOdifier) domain
MRMHPIFHISLLEPAEKDTIFITPRLDIEVYEEEHEPERIIDKRTTNGKTEYLVKWKGYSDDDNTWEPPKNLRGAPRLLKQYHKTKQPHRNPPLTPDLAELSRNVPPTPVRTPQRRNQPRKSYQ